MKKSPIQVFLDSRDRELLQGLMDRHGLSIADAVRQAVRRWAIDESREEDPLLALIGTMDGEDVPTDLSTRHDEYAVRGAEGTGSLRVAERRRGEE
jgi:hypothetical protein